MLRFFLLALLVNIVFSAPLTADRQAIHDAISSITAGFDRSFLDKAKAEKIIELSDAAETEVIDKLRMDDESIFEVKTFANANLSESGQKFVNGLIQIYNPDTAKSRIVQEGKAYVKENLTPELKTEFKSEIPQLKEELEQWLNDFVAKIN